MPRVIVRHAGNDSLLMSYGKDTAGGRVSGIPYFISIVLGVSLVQPSLQLFVGDIL